MVQEENNGSQFPGVGEGSSNVQNRVENKVLNSVPTGVKVIAVLNYIGAGFLLLFALIMILGASAFDGFLYGYMSVYMRYFGVIFVILGVLYIFIGIGLWRGKNWARIITIIFSVLGAFFQIWFITQGKFMGITGIIINGVIVWYLGFNEDINIAFSK